MRLIGFVLCLLCFCANTVQAQQSTSFAGTSAERQALQCSNPDEQAECKMYYAGFAYTVDIRFKEHLCGNVDDLLYEFENEVRINPAVRKQKGGMVLFSILAKNHSCEKVKGRIQNRMTAGNLIDMCHAGDIGFNLCTYYMAGFTDALAIESKLTEKAILCGDARIMERANVARMLNDKLHDNFRLRRDSAVEVMFNDLVTEMPCSTVPQDVAQLMAQEEKLNDRCRGGSGDDNATQKACDVRDDLLRKLQSKNWCWGHEEQIGAERTWEPCRHKN